MTAEKPVALASYRFWRRHFEEARPDLLPAEMVAMVRDLWSGLQEFERQERRQRRSR